MKRFDGATVVVTGASRGLGRDIAVAFGGEGGFVYVGFRKNEAKATETLRLLRAAGGDGALMPCDVRNVAEVTAAATEVLGARARVDVLVNNAGVAADAPFALSTAADFDDVLATNLGGAARCCRAFLPSMWAAKSGAIVNVASIAGLRASPGQASYAASKAGLLALTTTLAAECAGKGVRVNAVLPGLLDTGMAARLDRRILSNRLALIPAGRLGTGNAVTPAVLFLASADASYIVGHGLVVDGGLSL